MTGLLDLPVELIEQIYDELYEELDCDTWYQLGHLRLTCRYLERATRKPFLEDQCNCKSIRVTEDASILRFCATTENSDFAKAYKCIHFLTHDDGTVEAEARKPEANSSVTSTDPTGSSENSENVAAEFAELRTDDIPNGSAKLRSMVPAALLRNEDRLLEALRACENVDSLEVWANYSRGKMPDHRTLPDPTGDEGDHVYPFDVSSTFDVFMSLAVRAGIYPTNIGVVVDEQSVICALTNAAGFVTGKGALRRLENLRLAFMHDWRDDVDSEQEA